MALYLMKTVQDELKLCQLCSNEDSNRTDQLVLNNEIANISDRTIAMKNSSFRLDGFNYTTGNDSSSGIASVSVTVSIIC